VTTAEELLREIKDLLAEIKKIVEELLEVEKRSHEAREKYYRETAEVVEKSHPVPIAPIEMPENHPRFPEFVASMGFTMSQYWALDPLTKRALRQAFVHWLAEKEKRKK
jgi:hypothetical protein